MIATRTDVINVLRLLGGAFPTFPLDEVTLSTYVETLSLTPLDVSLLNSAAVTWVSTQDRYPTIHQLSDAYLIERRREQADRRAAEDERVQAAGMLPGVSLDPGYAVEMVDVLREALGSVGNGGLPHRHHGGDASRCPTCSRSDEIQMQVAASFVRIAADRGLRPPPGVETYKCLACFDRGFVVTDEETFTARPCGDCNPDGYERWSNGHLMPGHSCGECSDLVRGGR